MRRWLNDAARAEIDPVSAPELAAAATGLGKEVARGGTDDAAAGLGNEAPRGMLACSAFANPHLQSPNLAAVMSSW